MMAPRQVKRDTSLAVGAVDRTAARPDELAELLEAKQVLVTRPLAGVRCFISSAASSRRDADAFWLVLQKIDWDRPGRLPYDQTHAEL
jgi:hypothetical protein